MDLPYEARIEVTWSADGDLAAAIEEHADRIARETLATGFARADAASSDHDTKIDGAALGLGISAA
jgi:hypothetical protein